MLQLAQFISQSGNLASLVPEADSLLQYEQPLLTSRLGTQHKGSHQQGNRNTEHLHGDTLHKQGRHPKMPPKGLIW
jgi:hypothetical protein